MKTNNLIRIYLAILSYLLAAIFLLLLCSDALAPLDRKKPATMPAQAESPEVSQTEIKRVVLDAGHGGIDSGAQSATGVLEKDLNLQIATKTAQFLSLFRIEVIQTRDSDELPQAGDKPELSVKQSEMLARERIANAAKADLFLSVHMNSYPAAECRGAQVFFTEQNPQNEVFASFLQHSIASCLQHENSRTIKSTSQIYLLNRLSMPSALIECGFLSTPDELESLCDEDYQNKFAFVLASSIAAYLYQP